ncbi:MAG: ankyrin repeat-containing domain protein [Benjaminiella poitrasii]|nr:MAG: ankyrin repeat-containing domain protein [Benjaminiella poitrasii]
MKGNLEVVKILVKAGALLNRTTKDGRTALYLAVQKGNVQVTKYLTDQYQEAITQATQSGRLPTQAAAAYHEPQAAYDMTTYLLSHTRSRGILEHCDNSGRNLMVDATLAQNLDLLSYLVLDQGVDVNDRDTLGRNMIHHAAMMGHLKVLELFLKLDQGKTVEWDGVDSWDHWTPLMHAARQGNLNVVQFLIETIHANKSIRDKQGRTAKDIGKENLKIYCNYLFKLNTVLFFLILAVLWKHDSVAEYLL